MFLILRNETLNITPRIIKDKMKTHRVYIEIEPGHGCSRDCCNIEYEPYEAIPEDEWDDLPPFH